MPFFSSLFPVFICAVLGSAAHAQPRQEKPSVELQSKVFTLPVESAIKLGLCPADSSAPTQPLFLSNEQLEKLIRAAAPSDAFSSPKVSSLSGERAVIEVIREFRYPTKFAAGEEGALEPTDFVTENLGWTLDVTPTLTSEGTVSLKLACEISFFDDFAGYLDGRVTEAAKNGASPHGGFVQPVFGRTRVQFELNFERDKLLMIGGIPCLQPGKLEDHFKDCILDPSKLPAAPERRLQFLIFSAKAVPKDHSQPAKIAPTPQMNSAIPYAIPTTTLGIVLSPHAPNSGTIDVRGQASGAEIKCPFSGKMLLVP